MHLSTYIHIYTAPWLSAAFFVRNNNHFINYETDKICRVDSLICGLLGMAALSVLLASAVHCQAIVRPDFGSARPKTILLELC